MAARKRFSGVSRKQRVRIATRRDDTRTFRQRMLDTTSTTGGTVGLFGFIALAALGLSWAPFMSELLFIVALVIFLKYYRFKTKRWSVPFRVPTYLSKMLRQPVLDATTGGKGEGNLYMGMDEESGEEVWASTGDVNKHVLMIGTTGSGKTEAILGHIFGFLAKGSGALLVDGKASVNTYDSAYKVSRLLAREIDLLVMDYLTGGKDVIGPQQERRSHTYNPLAFGGPAQKSETMVSLLDGGDPMWTGRAITFLESIIPPLSYLSERGFVILNSGLLNDFAVIETVENLIHHGVFIDPRGKLVDLKNDHLSDFHEMQRRSGGIHAYLEGLPSYANCRPAKPVLTPKMDREQFNELMKRYPDEAPKPDPNARNETSKQHGFIHMQLIRALNNLTNNYGFIYGAEVGEISYRDVVLNRRSMIVLLPALERGEENLKQLGKLTVLSLKSVLGAMLEGPAEGKRREIVEGNPSRARIPFMACLDEVGYYLTEGTAVIPAQARSLGVSMYFGTQTIPDLMKASEHEGKAIVGNTALKFFGRLTSDSESDNARAAINMGGKAHVQVADQMNYRKGFGGIESNLSVEDHSGLQEHYQISYDDLVEQENGEFHLVVGAKDTDAQGIMEGGQRVVRMLAFYTGLIPNIEDWRRNPFCAVKPPPKAEFAAIRESETAARKMRYRMSVAFENPASSLRLAVQALDKGTHLAPFLAMRRDAIARGEWPSDGEARKKLISDWLADRLARIRLQQELKKRDAQRALWLEEIGEEIEGAGLPVEITSCLHNFAQPWFDRARQAVIDEAGVEPEEISPVSQKVHRHRDLVEEAIGVVAGE